nr:HAD family hydrolase [Pectinatus cerevisiiphilus]
MDDTLYDLMQPFQNVHKELYIDKTNIDCNELFIKSRIYSDKILELEKKGFISSKDCFYLRIKKTYHDAGITISKKDAELFEVKYRYHQARISLPDIIVKILNLCRKNHILIAILSNGRRQVQYRKILALGLNRWFSDDKIFISEDTGYLKPDINAFKYIEKQLNIISAETWYIGDTYETDIIGAYNAGWKTVWFNHRQRLCPEPTSLADKEVKSSADLLSAVEKLI